MKKICVWTVVVSVCLAGAARAESWKSYYKSSDGNQYLVDKNSVKPSGDGSEVRAIVMWKFGNPGKYNGISKVKMGLRADCLEKTLTASDSIAYGAKGKILNKDENSTELDTASNPVNDAALQLLCKEFFKYN